MRRKCCWLLLCAFWLAAGGYAQTPAAGSQTATGGKATHPSGHAAGHAAGAGQAGGHGSRHSSGRSGSGRGIRHKRSAHTLSSRSRARSRRLTQAFAASSELRPMAQQLAKHRSTQAFAAIHSYAQSHTGEAASAAYLALGHAYLADHRYSEALENLELARQKGELLDDYAVFLAANAALQAQNYARADAALKGFEGRYPDSVLASRVPALDAQALLLSNDAAGALRVLTAASGTAAAAHADYQLALAKAMLATGSPEAAAKGFRRVYVSYPTSGEALEAKLALAGFAPRTLSWEDLRRHAEAMYGAGRFSEAGDEYRAVLADPGTPAEQRTALSVAAAAADARAKRLSVAEARALPDADDENGARRLYLLMELARGMDDTATQQQIVAEMERRFPASPWLAEALFSSGNMYLLRKDYAQAVSYYADFATRFPHQPNGPVAQWRAGWWSYRQGKYADATRYFDDNLKLYPESREVSAVLYWRGRLFEEQDHRPDMAVAYYQAITRGFSHYFYAQMARQRLLGLKGVAAASAPALARYGPKDVPPLSDDVPEDDPHVVKAKLLANAALNEYIAPEIAAADGSREWGAFAEAEIYTSYGEAFRAMRVLKRALPYYTSAELEQIPLSYWRALFPRPWWATIEEESTRNGLDPYMVASLIRQESEFNPGAISHSNAYGLMQMLPSVGRQMARQAGIARFDTSQLLDPVTNIRLGTRYLRQTLDKFGNVPEYAFAAYNAGDDRVADWQAAGSYRGIDEFVESIPFTETREYVQAIVRNQEMYRLIDGAEKQARGAAVPKVATAESGPAH